MPSASVAILVVFKASVYLYSPLQLSVSVPWHTTRQRACCTSPWRARTAGWWFCRPLCRATWRRRRRRSMQLASRSTVRPQWERRPCCRHHHGQARLSLWAGWSWTCRHVDTAAWLLQKSWVYHLLPTILGPVHCLCCCGCQQPLTAACWVPAQMRSSQPGCILGQKVRSFWVLKNPKKTQKR